MTPPGLHHPPRSTTTHTQTLIFASDIPTDKSIESVMSVLDLCLPCDFAGLILGAEQCVRYVKCLLVWPILGP